MYFATFKIGSWNRNTPAEGMGRVALALTEALAEIDAAYLESHAAPLLYESGVVYREETNGEELLDVPGVLSQGFADCEDLAAWRCAEIRTRFGHKSWIEAIVMPRRESGNLPRFGVHLIVGARINGQVVREDPSHLLGMRY